MPNSRLPPCGLGIATRCSGLGVQRPARSFARIFSPWRAKWDASWPVVLPSMPAAPWLRFTAASARRRFSWAATCSIRSPCIAFCRESRGSRSGSRRPWLAAAPPLLPPPAPRRVPPAGKDLSARDSGKPLARSASRSSSFAPWSFSPSLQRRYPPSSLLWPLLTSPPLSRRSSPQVRRCFCPFIPPGLYLARLVWIAGFAVASTLTARRRPLCGSCSCGQRFVSRFLRLGRATCAPRLALCGSLRLPPSVPAGSFHPARISPCWAHGRAHSCVPCRHSRRHVLVCLSCQPELPPIRRCPPGGARHLRAGRPPCL